MGEKGCFFLRILLDSFLGEAEEKMMGSLGWPELLKEGVVSEEAWEYEKNGFAKGRVGELIGLSFSRSPVEGRERGRVGT